MKKSILPHDAKGHVQAASTALAPDGTVYVNQPTLMCKSTDGGHSWTSHQHQENMGGAFEILGDGTLISVTRAGKSVESLIAVVSRDEGRTWEEFSRIGMPQDYHERYIYTLFRLPDGTVLCGVSARNMKCIDGDWTKLISGKTTLLMFRSEDGGKNWQGLSTVADWRSEGV